MNEQISMMMYRSGNPILMARLRYSCRCYQTDSRYDIFFGQFYDVLVHDDYSVKGINISNISKYQNTVWDLLRKSQVHKYDSDRLIELQKNIEELAYPYDDIQNMYQASPLLINLLIKGDEPSAKDYLKASNKLTSDEQECLNRFHQYTLEGIIVYIFGYVFNSVNESPAVSFLPRSGFFEDKSIIEGLEAGSLTQQFLLLE